jgi:hypothetical protein
MNKIEKVALTVGAIFWVVLISYFFYEMLK